MMLKKLCSLAACRTFCIILTYLIPLTCFAERSQPTEHEPWTYVARDDLTSAHIDLSRIERSGNLVQVRVLGDFWERQDVEDSSFMSAITHVEHDCKEGKSRILESNFYSDNLGSGHQVFSITTPSLWFDIPPHSVASAIHDKLCSASP